MLVYCEPRSEWKINPVGVFAPRRATAAFKASMLGFAPRVDVGVIKKLLELAGPIRVVAIHRAPFDVVVDEIADQVLRDAAVTGLPGVTTVSVTISESGSMPTWPL